MIKRFVDISNEGDIQGYYASDIHDEIPSTAVEITEAQWSTSLDINANKYVDGAFLRHEPKFSEDEVATNNLLFRKTAYEAESDHLYLEWQFDKTDKSEQAWRDKVTEIKQRFPIK